MSQVWPAVVAVAAVLTLLGGVLKYLIRISVGIERAGSVAHETGKSLARHMEQSERIHEALLTQAAQHGQELAVLAARARGRG